MINLGVLGSTNGTDLQSILDAIGAGKLDAKVSVVISNRENSYILERAKKHNTPNVFINHKGKVREDFDSEMTNILKEHNVDLILLIGFMRILSSNFYSNGKFSDILYTDGGPSINSKVGKVRMNGKEVFKHAVEKLYSCLIEAINSANLKIQDIDFLVPHLSLIHI